ncbi:MAG: hypothetical protein IPF66_16345 [Holophagales bacterium]|nr:hypothetical protein [Holophagales bacterium]
MRVVKRVALMVASSSAATAAPVIVKVPVVWPAAIRALAGTVATFVLFDERVTVAPEGPLARSGSASQPPPPPGMVAGVLVRLVSAARVTVSVFVFETPPAVAVRTTAAFVSTGRVVTAAVAVLAPARTVTEAGSVAACVFPLARVTTVPTAGAFP